MSRVVFPKSPRLIRRSKKDSSSLDSSVGDKKRKTLQAANSAPNIRTRKTLTVTKVYSPQLTERIQFKQKAEVDGDVTTGAILVVPPHYSPNQSESSTAKVFSDQKKHPPLAFAPGSGARTVSEGMIQGLLVSLKRQIFCDTHIEPTDNSCWPE